MAAMVVSAKAHAVVSCANLQLNLEVVGPICRGPVKIPAVTMSISKVIVILPLKTVAVSKMILR